MGTLEIGRDAFPGAQVNLTSQKLNGWILFQADAGYPREAEVQMAFAMDIRAGGQNQTADTKVKTHVTASLE